MSLGGVQTAKKVKPRREPTAPARRDKKIVKESSKATRLMSHTSSTLSTLLSARADGVIGAAPPTKSTITKVMAK